MDNQQSEREAKKAKLRNSETMKEFFGMDTYNRPICCKDCGGVLVYKGVGEYRCEDCGALDYDDYGKVRNYIEQHSGATAAEASQATGVSQKKIRIMLKESRLEVAADSNIFLRCEICGVNIRSGRFCPKCEAEYHRRIEAEARADRKNMAGYGTEETTQEGVKRFQRDR